MNYIPKVGLSSGLEIELLLNQPCRWHRLLFRTRPSVNDRWQLRGLAVVLCKIDSQAHAQSSNSGGWMVLFRLYSVGGAW